MTFFDARREGLNLILLLLLSLATAVDTFAQQKTIFIAGRAVDERGEPVAGAIITLYYPPCRGCIDHVLPATYSLPDGAFFIDYTDVSLERV